MKKYVQVWLLILCIIQQKLYAMYDCLRDVCSEKTVQEWLDLGIACANTQAPVVFSVLPDDIQGRIFAQIHPMQDVSLWQQDDPLLVKKIRIPRDVKHFRLYRDYFVCCCAVTSCSENNETQYDLYAVNVAEPNAEFVKRIGVPEKLYGYGYSCQLGEVYFKTNLCFLEKRLDVGYSYFKKSLNNDYSKEKWCDLATVVCDYNSFEKELCAKRFLTLLKQVRTINCYWDSLIKLEEYAQDEKKEKKLFMHNGYSENGNKVALPVMSLKLGDLNQLPIAEDYRLVTVHKKQKEGAETQSIVSIYVPNAKACIQHYCVYQAYIVAMYVNKHREDKDTIFTLFHKPIYTTLIQETAEHYDCKKDFEAWKVFKKSGSASDTR